MSIIFFLWFWTMELIAISTVAISVSIILKMIQNKENNEEKEEEI